MTAGSDALLVRLQQKDAEATNLALLIDKLKLQIAVLKRARFGASSEKLDTQIEQRLRPASAASRPMNDGRLARRGRGRT